MKVVQEWIHGCWKDVGEERNLSFVKSFQRGLRTEGWLSYQPGVGGWRGDKILVIFQALTTFPMFPTPSLLGFC